MAESPPIYNTNWQQFIKPFSDLLFQTKINHKDGYLYLLFEHKSYPSPKIALQLYLSWLLISWKTKAMGGIL
ncbi:Rpn family recombination-promoting nuclease/putative transposase [Desulfosporosinus shakirovi]|uniref:Rpn family recombination-promoting nuclease/putative transposase n=1 Tax=Desulfosporosinus shakirovi TaxID=2885154 RepID=UPI001E3443FA|nr:Rpn family recombination-promoting nuclease/putative transposase [Desulfosporosinus sp. SRJS8]MCB8818113.1 Rpn family recombination-promoting nuclease/putative transposase [Desulfosporosinus sp. SRJS8]